MSETFIQVTEPPILDQTGQDIKTAIESGNTQLHTDNAANLSEFQKIALFLKTLADQKQGSYESALAAAAAALEAQRAAESAAANAAAGIESVTGKLSDLNTADKSKLQAAINEVNTRLVTATRRSRLTSFSLDTLKQAVAAQDLAKYGLRVGDQTTINGYTYVIAGLNPMKGTSTPYRVTANHVGLIVIPHTTHAWNVSGNTYTGADGRGAGYANCDLHDYLKTTTLPHVQTDLGASNLIAHSKLLSNAVNTTGYNRYGQPTGCTSGWAWVENQYICALSEVQVYGATVWSSSGHDTGEACRQLDVFRVYNHTEIFGSEYPWLRDVTSASIAARASGGGVARDTAASDGCYVAALVLFH